MDGRSNKIKRAKKPTPRTAKSVETKTVRVTPENIGDLAQIIAEGNKNSREELAEFLQSIMRAIENEKNAISSDPNFEARSQTYVSEIDRLYNEITRTNYCMNELGALIDASKGPDYFSDLLHRLLFFMLRSGDAFSGSKHYFKTEEKSFVHRGAAHKSQRVQSLKAQTGKFMAWILEQKTKGISQKKIWESNQDYISHTFGISERQFHKRCAEFNKDQSFMLHPK